MTEAHLVQSYDGRGGLIAWGLDYDHKARTVGLTTFRQWLKHHRLNLYIRNVGKESEEL